MTLLTSEIVIAAPSEVVWEVLVDFGSYGEWNPVEIEAHGEAVVGGVLEHTAQLPGHKPMTFKAKIIEATPAHALAWKGRIVIPGLFDVTHHFEIEPLADGHSRLRQFEHFSGRSGAVHARRPARHTGSVRARESGDQATCGEPGGKASRRSEWVTAADVRSDAPLRRFQLRWCFGSGELESMSRGRANIVSLLGATRYRCLPRNAGSSGCCLWPRQENAPW
jgi:hypothetical protein